MTREFIVEIDDRRGAVVLCALHAYRASARLSFKEICDSRILAKTVSRLLRNERIPRDVIADFVGKAAEVLSRTEPVALGLRKPLTSPKRVPERVSQLRLPTRAYHALLSPYKDYYGEHPPVTTIDDLLATSPSIVYRRRNCGKKTILAIEAALRKYGIRGWLTREDRILLRLPLEDADAADAPRNEQTGKEEA